MLAPLQVALLALALSMAGNAALGWAWQGARGDAPVGQRVFVRGGLIEGDAPSLPIVVLEI